MLSYVIPSTQEANSSNVSAPLRSTNLNLSPQVTSLPSLKSNSETTQESQKVDIMLGNVDSGDSYDECTRLIDARTPPRTRRSNNKINCGLTNNNMGDETVSDICADLTTTLTVEDLHTSDTQSCRQIQKKPKLSKLGSKSVGLKRVSFGSSKGSMVETLVFETPTPLSEYMEPNFGIETEKNYKTHLHQLTNHSGESKANLDDSGIEIQEESERSIVRVSIYQSSQPQQICPPDYLARFEDNLDNSLSNYNILGDIMTTASTIPGYDRQQSTDSGWDNPFRPGGDLSREADEIVNLIRGGKPITPIEDHSINNGNAQKEEYRNGNTILENVTKSSVTQSQSTQNGTSSHKVQPATDKTTDGGTTSLAQVSKQVVPGPTSASHVVIDEKKNKKKGCCIIQ